MPNLGSILRHPEVTDEIRKRLVPSELPVTEKARLRAKEIFSKDPQKNQAEFDDFIAGKRDSFTLYDRGKTVVIDWPTIYRIHSYGEIWEMVKEQTVLASLSIR